MGTPPDITAPTVIVFVFEIVPPRCVGSSYKLPKSKIVGFGSTEYNEGCVVADIVASYVFGASAGNQFFPLYEYNRYPVTPDALLAAIPVPRGSPFRVSLVLASHMDPFQ
jgi:hypothetical protein